MRLRIFLCAFIALFSNVAFSQTTKPSTDERLDRLERKIDELESQLKSRDEEIARLKTPATHTDGIEKTRASILKDIESRESAAPTLRIPASFNPDFAVITDFKGNISTANDNPARNRFGTGAVEFELRAAVDPRADAVAVIPFTREVEDPLFFSKADASGDVDTGAEIEEAYLLLHDFGVPNLTAKVGRFHLRFGRWNLLHDHDWPTIDNNFTTKSFLANESITDDGVSLSYVIPPKLIGDNYVEAIAEIISGEGGDEQPVFDNDAFVDSPALNTHLLWNHDVARDWNFELGGSWLTGKHNDDNQQNANLFGADFTLIHTDPTGGFFNQLIQGEAIYGIVDADRDNTQHSWGGWLLAQQQLNRDFYTGVRLDWTQDALNDHRQVWGVSPYLTWYWSEFLRFRAEYQHKDGDTPSEDTLFFQATWVFGAHPPHPYWSMK